MAACGAAEPKELTAASPLALEWGHSLDSANKTITEVKNKQGMFSGWFGNNDQIKIVVEGALRLLHADFERHYSQSALLPKNFMLVQFDNFLNENVGNISTEMHLRMKIYLMKVELDLEWEKASTSDASLTEGVYASHIIIAYTNYLKKYDALLTTLSLLKDIEVKELYSTPAIHNIAFNLNILTNQLLEICHHLCRNDDLAGKILETICLTMDLQKKIVAFQAKEGCQAVKTQRLKLAETCTIAQFTKIAAKSPITEKEKIIQKILDKIPNQIKQLFKFYSDETIASLISDRINHFWVCSQSNKTPSTIPDDVILSNETKALILKEENLMWLIVLQSHPLEFDPEGIKCHITQYIIFQTINSFLLNLISEISSDFKLIPELNELHSSLNFLFQPNGTSIEAISVTWKYSYDIKTKLSSSDKAESKFTILPQAISGEIDFVIQYDKETHSFIVSELTSEMLLSDVLPLPEPEVLPLPQQKETEEKRVLNHQNNLGKPLSDLFRIALNLFSFEQIDAQLPFLKQLAIDLDKEYPNTLKEKYPRIAEEEGNCSDAIAAAEARLGLILKPLFKNIEEQEKTEYKLSTALPNYPIIFTPVPNLVQSTLNGLAKVLVILSHVKSRLSPGIPRLANCFEDRFAEKPQILQAIENALPPCDAEIWEMDEFVKNYFKLYCSAITHTDPEVAEGIKLKYTSRLLREAFELAPNLNSQRICEDDKPNTLMYQFLEHSLENKALFQCFIDTVRTGTIPYRKSIEEGSIPKKNKKVISLLQALQSEFASFYAKIVESCPEIMESSGRNCIDMFKDIASTATFCHASQSFFEQPIFITSEDEDGQLISTSACYEVNLGSKKCKIRWKHFNDDESSTIKNLYLQLSFMTNDDRDLPELAMFTTVPSTGGDIEALGFPELQLVGLSSSNDAPMIVSSILSVFLDLEGLAKHPCIQKIISQIGAENFKFQIFTLINQLLSEDSCFWENDYMGLTYEVKKWGKKVDIIDSESLELIEKEVVKFLVKFHLDLYAELIPKVLPCLGE